MASKVVFLVISILFLLIPHLVLCQRLSPGSTTFRIGPLITEFDAWLGANYITLNVGREADVRLYVLNLGNAIDSYTIDIKPTKLNVNLESNTIENVYPQDVKFVSMLVSMSEVTEGESVELSVCSCLLYTSPSPRD